MRSKGASLWVRPSPEVTSRNHHRSALAWIMRLLGATESQLDRLTDGDALKVTQELKEKAKAGAAPSLKPNVETMLATPTPPSF